MTSETREKIVAAALDCFLETGVDGTTLDQVRRRAGVSNGSLFHFFSSRDHLVQAIFLSGLAQHHAALLRAFRGRNRGPRWVVGKLVRLHLAWVQANPRLAAFLLGFRAGKHAVPGEEVLASSRAFFARVSEWLAAHGWSGSPSLNVIVALWIGPSHEYARQWLAGAAPQPPRAVAPLLADAAWNSLAKLFQ